jgi:AraC family transcriptional regulator
MPFSEKVVTHDSPREHVLVPLFESELVTVGRWRCPVAHPIFRDSGPAHRYLFCFPRTSVWIQHEGGRPFVADPNIVTYYNRGQSYQRFQLSDSGDHGDWFALHPHVIAETLATWDPSAIDREDRPFPFSHGPCDAATYLLQRAVFEHVNREPRPDVLFVEESVLDVLSRVSGLAYGCRLPQRASPRSRGRELAEAARAVLAERFTDSLSLAAIARLVDTSVFHLARLFRRETGTTLHAYRNQLRLRTALERLADPTTDLLTTALDLGYSSHSHFTESFRRTFRVTPSTVRGRLTTARVKELAAALSSFPLRTRNSAVSTQH